MNFRYFDSHILKLAQISFINVIHRVFIGYTPREPAVSPFKPINRPLKTDRYNGTTYIRMYLMTHK